MTNGKEIVISEHVIKRFGERVGSGRTIDSAKAVQRIKTIVKRGTIVANRPGDAYEIEYEGIGLACLIQEDKIIVITCLGDRRYRGWARRNEIQPRYRTRVC